MCPLDEIAERSNVVRDASRQTCKTSAPDQIRRRDAPCDESPAAAKRQKGQTESLAEEAALGFLYVKKTGTRIGGDRIRD